MLVGGGVGRRILSSLSSLLFPKSLDLGLGTSPGVSVFVLPQKKVMQARMLLLLMFVVDVVCFVVVVGCCCFCC